MIIDADWQVGNKRNKSLMGWEATLPTPQLINMP